jgi:nicotinate-nucleotide pyrophosphorylase (carboxylating)
MLTQTELNRIVQTALYEDAPWGDITSAAAIPVTTRGSASFIAREAGIMACGAVLNATFSNVDPSVTVNVRVADGEVFEADATLATVDGSLRSVLLGERVALNLLQRACGIATLTRQYVAGVRGTNTRIVDTRKTTPGLRALEKAAVRCGGGQNHRFSLSDAVMVKDNHIAIWRAQGVTIQNGLRALKESTSHTAHIEVEVDDLITLADVMDTDVADSVLLDNFSLADIDVALKIIEARCLIEVSGGITPEQVPAIAAAGVDIISVGALTHSVRAIDIGMDMKNS